MMPLLALVALSAFAGAEVTGYHRERQDFARAAQRFSASNDLAVMQQAMDDMDRALGLIEGSAPKSVAAWRQIQRLRQARTNAHRRLAAAYRDRGPWLNPGLFPAGEVRPAPAAVAVVLAGT